MLSGDKGEILCGGRHQIYAKILESLFTRLSAKAELVFFLDGAIKDTKVATWQSRQNLKYIESIKIMDSVNIGVPLNNIVYKFGSTVFTNTLLNAIEVSCQKFGKFHYTVSLECDQELARFCYENHRVLAVFSDDSDFLIFPGHWRYFSTKNLNLNTLHTKEYNRVVFHSFMKLSNYQLAVFATIAGNDIIRRDSLQAFHSNFGFKVERRFDCLVKYIKSNFSSTTSHTDVLNFLSREIYGNTQRENMDRINKSIKSYRMTIKDDSDENPYAELLHDQHVFTFNVLNAMPINFSLVFFDLRQDDMFKYFDLCAGLFQRQAGIILHHALEEANLRVYTKLSHCQKYREKILQPVLAPFNVPLLDDIFADDPSFDPIRFDMLKWTINWEKLQHFNIVNIPSNYMIDVLTILYLRHKVVITSKEADILLWTIKNAENGTIPRNLKPPAELDPRAFRLAFLYVRMFGNVARSIEVCGLKKRYWVSFKKFNYNCDLFQATFINLHNFQKALNFDGVFFHREYLKYQDEEFNTYEMLNDL